MIRQKVKEKFGHEAVEEIDRYMEGRGSNVILVYANDYTFEVLGGVVTDRTLDIDSMIDQIGIDMDEYAAWKGWEGWDYDSLIMIGTKQWNSNRIVGEIVDYLKTLRLRRPFSELDNFLENAELYAGIELKAKYPWLRYREFKEIVQRSVEEYLKQLAREVYDNGSKMESKGITK